MAHQRAARILAVDARGQTASEYLGILLVVALIISALVTLGVPALIAQGIDSLIDSIAGGDDPRGG